MGSSDGGGGNPGALLAGGVPLGGLPIAGQTGVIDPANYGKYQNFLPDIKAEGQNDMATGLRPDMFKYRSPNGDVASSSGSGGSDQSSQLRDLLAQLQSGGGGGGGGGMPGMGGGGGNMFGMGRGGVPGGNAFTEDVKKVPMQGQYGGADQYGRGNFSSGPTVGQFYTPPSDPGGMPGSPPAPAGGPTGPSGDKVYPPGWQGSPGPSMWGPGVNAPKGDPNVPAAIPDSAWALMGLQKPAGG